MNWMEAPFVSDTAFEVREREDSACVPKTQRKMKPCTIGLVYADLTVSRVTNKDQEKQTRT